MIDVKVKQIQTESIVDFLQARDYFVETADDNVLRVYRPGDVDVYVHLSDRVLTFEMDVGEVQSFSGDDLYFKLLDLNTEILPVSVGIDSTSVDKPRIVLIESREVSNLDDNELLSVFEAMEIASVRVEAMLSQYIK